MEHAHEHEHTHAFEHGLFIINEQQFNTIEAGVIENLAYTFFVKLIEEGFEVADKSVVSYVIHDAMGMAIEENAQIYEYAKIAVNHKELLSDHKPSWAINILYSDSDTASRLKSLKSFIAKNNKTVVNG